MKTIPVALIVFGIIVIVFPDFLRFLVGGFFIFLGLNILIFTKSFKSGKEEYVKFGKYKIYR